MRFLATLTLSLLILTCALDQHANAQNFHASNTQSWMQGDIALNDIPFEPLHMDDLEKTDVIQNLGLTQTDNAEIEPLSALEEAYGARIVDDLRQYGYDLFQDRLDNTERKPAGHIDDSYILSAGDVLEIIIRGQQNTRQSAKVNDKGQLILDDFPPIAAAARTLGQIRTDLEDEASAMHNTQIYVSISGIRQIGVLVVGNVRKPGRKTLTSFHTVMDALSEAEGIDKTGSLRRIKLIRGGKSHRIDLYHLLMKNGGRADMLLQDGDRIVVPPIGSTLAVTGFVKRPGIYEIHDREKLSLRDMLGLGGNLITPGKNRYIKMDFDGDGQETIQDIETKSAKLFQNGSILNVLQSKAARNEFVTLAGHTREPGTHAISEAKQLSDLISSSNILGDDIYPLLGVIERKDKSQLTKKLIPFSPHQVLKKTSDQTLHSGDTITLFSNAQIRHLTAPRKAGNDLLHEASAAHSPLADNIHDPVLRSFLTERAAFIRGAVRSSGAYPLADGTTLDNLLAVAGGLKLEANQDNIELTLNQIGGGAERIHINLREDDAAAIFIGAGDTVRVNQKTHAIVDNSVSLMGEVKNPGRYDLMPGDTLLDLIERAGGLNDYAFAPGAIFSRAAERKNEERRYKSQAQNLELKLASSLQSIDKDEKPDLAQVNAVQSLIGELKSARAVGRITVEADPAVLTTDREQNILLESGDKIFIPKRPLTVRVAGEILSPAALQFRKDKDARDYIREAGGTTYYADDGRSFVIYPDGSAQPLRTSTWQHSAVMIPPGSTIIVPRDPKPFSFLEGAERISQIFANLAISGLYIDAIGDDN